MAKNKSSGGVAKTSTGKTRAQKTDNISGNEDLDPPMPVFKVGDRVSCMVPPIERRVMVVGTILHAHDTYGSGRPDQYLVKSDSGRESWLTEKQMAAAEMEAPKCSPSATT